MTSTVATPANPGESQVVNASVFDIDYSVEDVGPSGVSAVELFVTEDGGQNWFKYGTDADLKSPFTVDTMGEGTFGFAVRVRNGLGFSDTPPQPGQAPEITVTVDTSAPRIEFAQPTVKADGFATIQLQWRVGDQNPSTTPVRLEYAASPLGHGHRCSTGRLTRRVPVGRSTGNASIGLFPPAGSGLGWQRQFVSHSAAGHGRHEEASRSPDSSANGVAARLCELHSLIASNEHFSR